MQLVDMGPDDHRLIDEVLPVLQELRPHLTAESLRDIYQEGYPQGLRYTAVYLDGRCVAVAGWRIMASTVAIRRLYVDDLVTTEASRSQGVGRALLAGLTDRARDAGCVLLDLDSATHRTAAHRFYMREGLVITAFHFGRIVD